METSNKGPASGLDIGEKALDAVVSLLQTIQSMTSIATPNYHGNVGQTVTVVYGPAEAEALNRDIRVRIAVLENELKRERAAKEVALSNLQQVIQLCAPTRNGHPYQTSVGIEKVNQVINLRELLNESKEENEELKARFRAATRIQTGELTQNYAGPASGPVTAEKSGKDSGSDSPTINESPFREQPLESPLDVESITDVGAADVDIKGAQDRLQELSHDPKAIGIITASRQLPEDIIDDGFRSLEEVLARDDEHEMVGL